MQSSTRSLSFALASLVLLAGAAVETASAATPTATATAASALRKPTPPRPPPPPATDSTLALASATAAGVAVDGNLCAISADGGKVLFTSFSNTVVSVDNTPFQTDIYLKNFNGNGVARVAANFSRNLACLAMTPDANAVVFADSAPNGVVNVLGFEGTETAILVLNLSTGQRTRVTPMLSTLPNVDSFQFAGVSDDGLRVAFIARPTRTCNIFDCTAQGPARMLVRDLATGQLINLESQVRFTTVDFNGEVELNAALLAPNGRTLAFSSRAAYPEVGSPAGGVFAIDIASRTVRPLNVDGSGRLVQLGGVRAFLSNSSKVAFFNATTTDAGPAGVYVKDLNSGTLTRLPANLTLLPGSDDTPLSFSDDGRRVSYVRSNGLGGQFSNSLPLVLDLNTGAVVNAATLTNGRVGNGAVTVNVLLSRDGRVAAFSNNSTNLLGGLSPLGGAELRAYRKLLP